MTRSSDPSFCGSSSSITMVCNGDNVRLFAYQLQNHVAAPEVKEFKYLGTRVDKDMSCFRPQQEPMVAWRSIICGSRQCNDLSHNAYVETLSVGLSARCFQCCEGRGGVIPLTRGCLGSPVLRKRHFMLRMFGWQLSCRTRVNVAALSNICQPLRIASQLVERVLSQCSVSPPRLESLDQRHLRSENHVQGLKTR
jgi:hypothetical protein